MDSIHHYHPLILVYTPLVLYIPEYLRLQDIEIRPVDKFLDIHGKQNLLDKILHYHFWPSRGKHLGLCNAHMEARTKLHHHI